MVFEDEMKAILDISDYITEAAKGLFLATKYIYALSAEGFYSCDVKDVFRIILNNPTKPEKLSSLGLSISGEDCAAVNREEYDLLQEMITLSFANRLPLFTDYGGKQGLSEEQTAYVYETVLLNSDKEAACHVWGSFQKTRRLAKKQRPPLPYSADWFKAYIYGNIGELADINARSFFFMGTLEPLFSMFNLVFEKELFLLMKTLAASPLP
ncbi:MAG: hypothetical protein GX025_08140 [Clostridiales bacterium]|nr:hypothetical protein [Clostridiales bacterium]